MRTRMLLVPGLASVAVAVAIAVAHRPGSTPPEPATRPTATLRAQAVERAVEAIQPALQDDDDPPGTLRLAGQVVEDGDQPMANATVVIDANPPREVQTKADGAFAFDGLLPRTYRVAARADTGTAGPVAVRLGLATEPIVLRMREAGRIVVSVKTAAARPVRGALVELRDLVSIAAVTDDAGNAVVRGVAAGRHVIKASADGHASGFGEIASSGDRGADNKIDIVLRPGASLSGAVVDSSGSPIEGARVLPEHVGHLDDPYDGRLDAVVTDAKGRWRLTGLPRETVRIRAYHAAFAPGASSPLILGDGDRGGVTIALDRGGRVRGRVVDTNGAPVAGAEVRIDADTMRSGQVRRVAADATGQFAMAGLPRDMMYAVAATDGATSKIMPLDLRGAEPPAVELRLDQAAAIAGVVVTTAGAPVAEARVIAEPARSDGALEQVGDRLRGTATAIAGVDGAFRIAGLPPGSYRVRGIRPGSANSLLYARLGTPTQTGASGVKIVVDDLSALTGRVALPDGRPVPRFAIRLGIAPVAWCASTDGAFRLDEVPAGKQFVRISGPDFVTLVMQEVAVDAVHATDLGTITVQPGRMIAGTVVDGQGHLVAGATVAIGREISGNGTSLVPYPDPDILEVVTGPDGKFMVRGIGNGNQQIAAEHETAGRSVMTGIPAGTTSSELALTLRPTGAIQGFVRSSGNPAEAIVLLRAGGGAANAGTAVRTGSDGSYRFDRVAADRYIHVTSQVHGTHDHGADSQSGQVEVLPGTVVNFDVDLTPSGVAIVLHLRSSGDVVKFGYGLIAMFEGPLKSAALPNNLSQARARWSSLQGSEVREGEIAKAQEITFANVRPGHHVACAAPLRGDPHDPAVIAELLQNLVDWPTYCKWIDVAAAPDPQHVTVEVQPLPPQ